MSEGNEKEMSESEEAKRVEAIERQSEMARAACQHIAILAPPGSAVCVLITGPLGKTTVSNLPAETVIEILRYHADALESGQATEVAPPPAPERP